MNEAEYQLIGCILKDETVFPKISFLNKENFTEAFCAEAFDCLKEMFIRDKSNDPVTLLNKLALKGFEKADIKQILIDCTNMVISTKHAEKAAELILKGYKVKQLKELAENITYSTNEINLEEQIAYIAETVNQIQQNASKKLTRPLKEYYMEALEEDCEEIKKRTINTGIQSLDNILQGLCEKELIILGARPATGKTALATTIAYNVAKQGKTVLFYNLEMSGKRLAQRMISRNAGLSLKRVIKKDFNKDEEWNAYTDEISNSYNYPLHISEAGNVDVLKIKADCMLYPKVDLIIIDFLQLLRPIKPTDNRNLDIGQISRDLKVLAMDLNIPILVLSQLSRDSEKRGNPEPILADLRDSGEIEQNANKVILLWTKDKEQNIIGCKVAKNRDGEVNTIYLKFDGDKMTHTVIEQYREPPKTRKAIFERED